MADESDRRARGLAVYKQMGWGENTAVKELDEDLWRLTTDVLFGEIWSRPGLSLRERELVTLATLMAAKADGIALHMRHAHNLGITFDEMKEVILQSTIYLGMPKALFAMRKLKAVMAEAGEGGAGAKSVTGRRCSRLAWSRTQLAGARARASSCNRNLRALSQVCGVLREQSDGCMSRRVLASERCRGEITDKEMGSMPDALRLATLAVATVALFGTATTGHAQEPIRIGVLQPMTGPATKNGTENFTAMQIAREMINERGGINGRKVEFLLADIPTPTAAISETERLTTKDGVKITLGSGVSLLAVPVSQAAERHGVFHWETAGAADIITKRGFKYTFQVGPAAYRYGQAALDLTLGELAKRLGKSPADLRIALLWENRAFGKSVGNSIRAYAKEKNVTLVYDEGYDQFLTDMTPIVQRLKDVKPDVLLAISFPNDAILFQRKAKELDFNVGAMVGVSAGYSNPDLRDSIGDMVNGIFVSDFAARVNPKALTPETLKIADEFFKRYDDKMKRPPAGHASSAFSATWALFTEVFPKAKTFEPAELREIALKLDLPEGSLANGSGIKFTNNDWPTDPKDAGQNLRASIGVWQWQKTGNNQVFPAKLATTEPVMVPLPNWSQR